jgi:translation elongation factor EF-1alpha
MNINLKSHGQGASEKYDLRMTIDDVFHITGRGVVAVGKVDAGIVMVGDDIDIRQNGLIAAKATVTGVEMFRKQVDVAGVGDHVGLLLGGVSKEQLKRGMQIVSPGAASAGFDSTPAKPVTVDGVPVTTTFNTAGTPGGGPAFEFSSFNQDETVDRLSDAAASAADHKDFTKGEEFRGLGFTDDSTPGHVGSKSTSKILMIVVVIVLVALGTAGRMYGIF